MDIYKGDMAKKGEKEATQLINDASAGKKFFIFEDFDHRAVENIELVSSKGVMQGLANNDYKHIGLEINRSEQRVVDNYVNGKISREDAVRTLSTSNDHLKGKDRIRSGEALVNLMDNAKANEIKVHCIDTMQPDNIIRQLSSDLKADMTVGQLREKLSGAVETYNELEKLDTKKLKTDYALESKQLQDAIKLLDATGVNKNDNVSSLDSHIKTQRDARADADKNVAEYLDERSNGQPAAIVIGAGHSGYRDGTNGAKDLEEHLSARGEVGRVGLAPNEKGTERFIKRDMSEIPNAMIYTDKGIIGSRYEAKIYDSGRDPGDEINIKDTKDFNTKKYQDYEPGKAGQDAEKEKPKKRMGAPHHSDASEQIEQQQNPDAMQRALAQAKSVDIQNLQMRSDNTAPGCPEGGAQSVGTGQTRSNEIC